MSAGSAPILEVVTWRRLDTPGVDTAYLSQLPDGWQLRGTTAFLDDRIPCALNYAVRCDSGWRAQSLSVKGVVGGNLMQCRVVRDSAGCWTLNGEIVPTVADCVDLDLEFSPATNSFAIRRLALEVGQSGPSPAAWFRFPALVLEPLSQTYRRIDERRYDYQSHTTGFRNLLDTTGSALVLSYPPFWEGIGHWPAT